ncbi:AsnC family transcriptional regulator [Candidatus Woesearchaeota archaeon]|nr:AsnC family transcriptional regulator [Candidatus Woesearchaeota archaeon]|tara:strand:+ start:613 stop:1074 length:462 start_codon:yes stop_codon:yes gene_type:complete
MTDAKDRKIIDALTDNSRQSFREIARKVGVSTVTVMKRVKRLEKEKTILGYSAVVDYEKLGYDTDVLINVKIVHGKNTRGYSRLAEKSEILKHPNVLAAYDVTGDFDAVIMAKFKNRRSLDDFLKKLQGYEYIERTNTIVVLDTAEKKGIKLS